MNRRALGVAALCGAAAGVGVATAIRVTGRRLSARADADLDDPLTPPRDVTHHHLVTPDGASLHVIDTGCGDTPPVLLLHGVTLQWWVWSAVIRLLRPRHRVLAWDMRGHGESTAGSRGTTLEATVDDLALVLRELDLRDVVVVGHSMGGMTLGQFAAAHHDLLHERCRGVVFVATSAATVSQAALLGGLVTVAGTVGTLAAQSVRRPRLAYAWRPGNVSTVMLSMAFGRSPTARMIDDVRRMEVEMDVQALADAASSIAIHDVRRDLGAVDLPTVVLVGTHDKLTPARHAKALARAVPDAELVVLSGIGHQVMQEDPSSVVRAVEEVASRQSVPGRRDEAIAALGG